MGNVDLSVLMGLLQNNVSALTIRSRAWPPVRVADPFTVRPDNGVSPLELLRLSFDFEIANAGVVTVAPWGEPEPQTWVAFLIGGVLVLIALSTLIGWLLFAA